MRAGLERRVRELEETKAVALLSSVPEKLSDFELARQTALILYRAARGDPEYREAGIEIARILKRARILKKET